MGRRRINRAPSEGSSAAPLALAAEEQPSIDRLPAPDRNAKQTVPSSSPITFPAVGNKRDAREAGTSEPHSRDFPRLLSVEPDDWFHLHHRRQIAPLFFGVSARRGVSQTTVA